DVEAAQSAIRDAFTAYHSSEASAKREKAALKRAAKSCVEGAQDYAVSLSQGGWITSTKRTRGKAATQALFQLHTENVWRPVMENCSRVFALKECDETHKALHPDASAVVWQRKYGAERYRKAITAKQWLAGASGYFEQYEPTLVRKRGGNLETSRGADAPFAPAVAIFKLAQECRHNSRAWKRDAQGPRAGAFSLNAIDTQGNITIGCHFIRFEEMQRLAVKECPSIVKARYPLPALVA
ncbi:MAG: hypothetical protein ACKO0Z_06300, partial [Betaproteobacteria bacterium]